jgi:hypothetical protein
MVSPLSLLRRVGRLASVLFASAALAARAACPTLLIERFIPADCEACWRSGSAAASGTLALDWIVPVAQGDEAALAAAALPEASRRAPDLQPGATLERTHALQRLRVDVEDGPAWNGYMGVVLRVQRDDRTLPPGATGFLALFEAVRPGEEGSPIERRVLRVLAGPLTLDAALPRVEHLLALRLPQGARGDRLGVVGWIEDGGGRVLAVAEAGVDACLR